MKRNKKMISQLMTMTCAAMAVSAILLTVIASVLINNAYDTMNRQLLEVSCGQFLMEINAVFPGDWHEEADGIYKGDTIVTGNNAPLDELKAKTGLEYTVFYGNVRIATTMLKEGSSSERAVNTTASEEVTEKVVRNGEEFYKRNMRIEGQVLNVYYMPIRNSNGSIIGMLYSGRQTSDIKSSIWRGIMTMVGVALILIVLVIIYGISTSRAANHAISEIVTSLSHLAAGNLNIEIDNDCLSRRDELGIFAENIRILDERLGGVIQKTLELSDKVTSDGYQLSESASQASQASAQVTQAMDEISRGAVSQAENVENAASNTSSIEKDIEEINTRVDELTRFAGTMSKSCESAMNALRRLLEENVHVADSMKVIDHQINSTNEAVKNISSASELITSISSQTNLLALNASIEAARAGDAGKGFAVVASEIGSLADQSQNATVEINNIVNELIRESEKSVETVNGLRVSLQQQSTQIESTRSDMVQMESGVKNVTASAQNIASNVEGLNSSRNNLVGIISDLSAISEENAASTEETNASMEELNATFDIINQSAAELQQLAAQLHKQISFFSFKRDSEKQ